MIKYIFNRFFNPKYRLALKDLNGKSIYADYCINKVENRAGSSGAKIRKKITKLIEKRNRYEGQLEQVEKHTILENDKYHSLRKKIRLQQFLFWILVIAEFGLNYFTTLIFLNSPGALFLIIRIAIAVAATAVGIITTEKLLEELLPKKRYKEIEDADEPKKRSILTLLMWLLLLIGFEVSIYYFGLIRGHDFESGSVGGDISKALVLISMLIPLVAGGIYWDILNYTDVYRNRRKFDKLNFRINRINKKQAILVEKENTCFQRISNYYWDCLCFFNNHKNLYNRRKKIEFEDLENHRFASDIDSFKIEAQKRYLAKLKQGNFLTTTTAPSINNSNTNLKQLSL